MLADSRPRRKAAGFIRTNSFKALPTFKNQAVNKMDSSDDFSSFEKNSQPQQSDSEFSPYKNASPKTNLIRPPLPPKQAPIFSNKKLAEGYQYVTLGSSSHHRNQQSDRDTQIKQGLRKRAEVQKELQQINKICSQIDQLSTPVGVRKNTLSRSRGIEKNLSKQKNKSGIQKYCMYLEERNDNAEHNERQFQLDNKEYKSGLNNSSRKQKLLANSKPTTYNFSEQDDFDGSPSFSRGYQLESKRKEYSNKAKQSAKQSWLKPKQDLNTEDFDNERKKRHSLQKSKAQDKDLQQLQRVQMEHKQARHRFISGSQYSQSLEQSEVLIQQYPTEEFAKKTIKQSIKPLRRSCDANVDAENQHGIYKAKGGICFDLDINQFTQPNEQNSGPKSKPVNAKNKKTNTKEQIMKRRQIAKNYDKYARAKVFGA